MNLKVSNEIPAQKRGLKRPSYTTPGPSQIQLFQLFTQISAIIALSGIGPSTQSGKYIFILRDTVIKEASPAPADPLSVTQRYIPSQESFVVAQQNVS